jgi:hypothetical protein
MLEIVVVVMIDVLSIAGLRWGLRIRRGEGRLPSEVFRRNSSLPLFMGDPDRNLLAVSLLGIGIAVLSTCAVIVNHLSRNPYSLTISAVGLSVFAVSFLLYLSFRIFHRPQALLPLSLREQGTSRTK